MAWNGSSEKYAGGTSASKRMVDGAKKRPSPIRGAIAALVVVALAAGCWLWLSQRNHATDENPPKQSKKQYRTPGNPAKPKPQVAKDKSVPEPAVEPKPEPQRFGKYEVEVDENGERWIYRGGKRRHIMSVKPGTSRQLFFNRAENQLSALLTVKPGEMIVGFEGEKTASEVLQGRSRHRADHEGRIQGNRQAECAEDRLECRDRQDAARRSIA